MPDPTPPPTAPTAPTAEAGTGTAAGSVGPPRTVLLVGTGTMGHPLAARLCGAGFEVVVHDRDTEVARRCAAEIGATPVSGLRDAGHPVDVAILMLPDGTAVREVVLDAVERDAGPLAGLDGRCTLIDMGSSDPSGTVELAGHLEVAGVTLLDAPVSGGLRRARSGELTIMVGGDGAAIDRCLPVLEAMGTTIVRTGAVGSGHATKALNNLLSAVGLLATAETLLVGLRFGLDPHVLLTALNASTGRNNSTESKIGQFVLPGTFDAGFRLDLMLKDVATALRMASATATPTPLSSLAEALAGLARQALDDAADHTEVVRWLADATGTPLTDAQRHAEAPPPASA